MRKYEVAIITVSDRSSQGVREDGGGPLLKKIMEKAGYSVTYTSIVPDEKKEISTELMKCADELGIPLILTTGGTGFSPRDVTPEATLAVIEKHVPGIPEVMRYESMKVTNRGMLSRAEAGIRNRSLIINLPGSPKALRENMEAILPALAHGLEILRGEEADCGSDKNHDNI